MALHTQLPIYRTGLQLLQLAHRVQEHMAQADTYAAGNSYLGLVRQATHSHQERAALCRALLLRGHPVEGLGLTKALRRVRNATTTKTIAASACGVSA